MPSDREEIAWLVERTIDGRPHWLAWRDYDERVWVTDANLADRYQWRVQAVRDARHLTQMGEACEATEHMWVGRSAGAAGVAGSPPLDPVAVLSERQRETLQMFRERTAYRSSDVSSLLDIVDTLLTSPRPPGNVVTSPELDRLLGMLEANDERLPAFITAQVRLVRGSTERAVHAPNSRPPESAGQAVVDKPAHAPDPVAVCQEAYEKMTPGEWQTRFLYRTFRRVRESPGDLMLGTKPEADWPDADGICALVNHWPAVSALVRELRSRIADLEAENAALKASTAPTVQA